MLTTVPTTTPTDLLRIANLTAERLNVLLDLADEMRDGPGWWTAPRSTTAIAFAFGRPSARTRPSFEAAALRLGLQPVVRDAAEAASSDVAAIVASASAHAELDALAAAAGVPVVNAGTDQHHPSHALADLLTIRRRFGYLDGIRLAYVGAADNVAHSLMEAGALAGMHVNVATPPGHEPRGEVTRTAIELAAVHGGSVNVMHDPYSAVENAHAVCGDGSMTPGYELGAGLIDAAEPGAVLLHLPQARQIGRASCRERV